MSYANGIGALQQALSSIAPAATPASQAAEAAAAANQHSTSVGKAAHADQANLSSAGGMIAHALEGSDVRSEKVAALQQAIASGSYKVSSSEVAGKMIQSLLE
jgi:negative regulator of flagellin synthesis FlgM